MEQKVRSSFAIVGKLSWKDNKPELKEFISNKSNWKGYSLQLGIKVGNGFHYVKFFGGDMFKDKSFTQLDNFKYYNEGNEITLTYDQVQDKEVFDKIPNWKKFKMNNKEFVYQTEFIKEVYDNLDQLKDQTVRVYGDVNFTYNKDKDIVYREFSVKQISLAQDGVEEEAIGSMQLVFDESSIDMSIMNKDGTFNTKVIEEYGNKISIRGYVPRYNSDKNTRDSVPYLFYPIDVFIKTDKIDFENPAHTKLLKFMISQCIPNKRGKIFSSAWNVKYQRGNSEIELTEEQKKSMLSKEELQYLEMFPDQEEAFLKKKLQMTSERIDETWLWQPHPFMPIKEEMEDLTSDILELYKSIGVYVKNETETKKEENKQEISSVDFSMFG